VGYVGDHVRAVGSLPLAPTNIISRLSCVYMIQANFGPPGSDQIDSPELNIRQKGLFKYCSNAQPVKMV
jgi:hypothetical protein